MTGAEFESGVRNILNNTPARGVNGSQGITKSIFMTIVAVFKQLLNDVNGIYEAGMNWRGAWVPGIDYFKKDTVSLNGSSYRAKVNTATAPPSADWELVAQKGDAANQVINLNGDLVKSYDGSMFRDAALERGVNPWVGGTISAGFNNLSSIRVTDNAILAEKEVVNISKLYKLEYFVKNEGSLVAEMGGILIDCYDSNDNFVNSVYPIGDQGWARSSNSNWVKRTLFFGGWLPTNIFENVFTGNLIKISPKIFKLQGDAIHINSFSISECPLGFPVNSDNNFLPIFQTVFDKNNYLKRGVYIGPSVGIVWNTAKEVVLYPFQPNIIFNIKRPYNFTWSIVNNDGVTINSQPAANVSAGVDALLNLTGTNGKTLTISIQQIQ